MVTGHHARTRLEPATGRWQLLRGVDAAKDQSYVVAVLDQSRLAKVRFPVGDMTKTEVRAIAAERGLRTAAKPDSQDVCFISATGGRRAFLAPRIDLHPGRVVDAAGVTVGTVDAVELVTVGQRRGLTAGGGPARYALDVDPTTATVTVGSMADLRTDSVELEGVTWVDGPVTGAVLAQTSAHGRPFAATVDESLVVGATVDEALVVTFDERQRRVAAGQAVVLFRGDAVLGGGTAR